MSEPVQISRDPFARESLMREVCDHAINYVCKWCGAKRKPADGETGCRHIFRYGTARDDRGGINWHRGEFCSKSRLMMEGVRRVYGP
jgi:hypothetical protein